MAPGKNEFDTLDLKCVKGEIEDGKECRQRAYWKLRQWFKQERIGLAKGGAIEMEGKSTVTREEGGEG